MRIRKRSLRARVNPDLPIAFSRERISAHGGIEVFRRFLGAIDFAGRLRRAWGELRCEGDYGSRGFVLCLMGLLLVGGRRITHLRVMERDPVFLRFAGLQRLPADRTVVRWMKRLPVPALERLATVIRDLVYDTISWAKLTRLTLDLDGTVLRTGLVRVSDQSEHPDRAIVNSWIGMLNTKIGHGEHLDRDREQLDRAS